MRLPVRTRAHGPLYNQTHVDIGVVIADVAGGKARDHIIPWRNNRAAGVHVHVAYVDIRARVGILSQNLYLEVDKTKQWVAGVASILYIFYLR